MNSELRIRTPEGIVFSYPLAGPITRCLAWIVDFLIVFALSVLGSILLAKVGMVAPDVIAALSTVLQFVISMGYGMVMEANWRGQTVGKRVFRLRVMDATGLRLGVDQVILRNLLRAVDSLPFFYLVGGLACLVTRKAQRLGDFVAGTVVVHIPVPFEPDVQQLLPGKYNSFRAFPHLAARLRQLVSPQEARVAMLALMRREQLEPAARVELFQTLANHFRSLVPFPPEVAEAIPDEQYVRNVADILFRGRG